MRSEAQTVEEYLAELLPERREAVAAAAFDVDSFVRGDRSVRTPRRKKRR